jgi:hypothetical protein
MELMNQHRGGTTPGGHLLTRLGVYTANPAAFLVLIVYAALWYMLNWPPFRPDSRHNLEGLRLCSSTGLCLTIINELN